MLLLKPEEVTLRRGKSKQAKPKYMIVRVKKCILISDSLYNNHVYFVAKYTNETMSFCTNLILLPNFWPVVYVFRKGGFQCPTCRVVHRSTY